MASSGGESRRLLRGLRWILAIGCLGLSWWLIRGAYSPGSIVHSFWLSLFGLGLLILTILLLLPEALAVATAPFNALIDSFFFPGGKVRPPGLEHYYRLIDSFRKQERWDDLAEVCEQLLRDHPGELRPYQELSELYADWPEPDEQLAQLRRKAHRHLCEEDFLKLEAEADLLPPPASD